MAHKPTKADPDSDIATQKQVERKLKKPPMYKVLFHNDDYTTMEFVVAVLREIFHRSEAEAVHIMLQVHQHGVGVAGAYTYEVAETKIKTTEALAQQQEYPLKLSMEPEET